MNFVFDITVKKIVRIRSIYFSIGERYKCFQTINASSIYTNYHLSDVDA